MDNRHEESGRGGPWEGSLIYATRAGTCLMLALLCWARFTEKETTLAVDTVFVLFLVIYPHFLQLLIRQRDRSVEAAANFVDAFVIGMVIYHLSFSFIPSAVVLTVVTANAIALNGPRQVPLVVALAAAGALFQAPFRGLDAHASAGPATDAVAAVLLILYFNLFALLSYRRSRGLKRSRAELHQALANARIEKARHVDLLHNILPPLAARELEEEGRVVARRHGRATLMVVTVVDLAEEAGRRPPEELVTSLNRLLQAVDAILTRHGLTKVKTMTFGCLAAGDLGEEGGADALALVRAAWEIHGHAAAQAACDEDGSPPLRLAVALGAGPVTAGMIETERFTYALWGEAVAEVMRLAGSIPCGEVWATPTLVEWLPEGAAEVVPARPGEAGGPLALAPPAEEDDEGSGSS